MAGVISELLTKPTTRKLKTQIFIRFQCLFILKGSRKTTAYWSRNKTSCIDEVLIHMHSVKNYSVRLIQTTMVWIYFHSIWIDFHAVIGYANITTIKAIVGVHIFFCVATFFWEISIVSCTWEYMLSPLVRICFSSSHWSRCKFPVLWLVAC